MEIIKLDELADSKRWDDILVRKVLKNEDVQVMNLVLEPGDKVPEHSVPVNVFFYIVEGSGTLRIGDDKQVVQAQDIIPCSPNTKMSLQADQDERFVVLNVKTPSL
ncbi:MAG: cupin domain-containing protein [Bacillota bacterium]